MTIKAMYIHKINPLSNRQTKKTAKKYFKKGKLKKVKHGGSLVSVIVKTPGYVPTRFRKPNYKGKTPSFFEDRVGQIVALELINSKNKLISYWEAPIPKQNLKPKYKKGIIISPVVEKHHRRPGKTYIYPSIHLPIEITHITPVLKAAFKYFGKKTILKHPGAIMKGKKEKDTGRMVHVDLYHNEKIIKTWHITKKS